VMIIDFKLTYPSGTATVHLINSFHTPQGAKLAKTKKVIGILGTLVVEAFIESKVFISIGMILGDGLYNFFKDSSLSLKQSYDDQCRTELFLKDQIPTWFAVGGYVAIAANSIATLPHIFHQLKWYYILVIYLTAPTLAFCNAYGSLHGGVLAGLASCGVMMNIASTASDLTQDFKTGFLTLASPRSMFVSQVIGTTM
ncbi:hypothetical protein S245_017130, partial [Arachis hypogaea]